MLISWFLLESVAFIISDRLVERDEFLAIPVSFLLTFTNEAASPIPARSDARVCYLSLRREWVTPLPKCSPAPDTHCVRRAIALVWLPNFPFSCRFCVLSLSYPSISVS